jgi:hypothetical protein
MPTFFVCCHFGSFSTRGQAWRPCHPTRGKLPTFFVCCHFGNVSTRGRAWRPCHPTRGKLPTFFVCCHFGNVSTRGQAWRPCHPTRRKLLGPLSLTVITILARWAATLFTLCTTANGAFTLTKHYPHRKTLQTHEPELKLSILQSLQTIKIT